MENENGNESNNLMWQDFQYLFVERFNKYLFEWKADLATKSFEYIWERSLDMAILHEIEYTLDNYASPQQGYEYIEPDLEIAQIVSVFFIEQEECMIPMLLDFCSENGYDIMSSSSIINMFEDLEQWVKLFDEIENGEIKW